MLNSDERLPSSRRCFSVNSIFEDYVHGIGFFESDNVFKLPFETVSWLGAQLEELCQRLHRLGQL